MKALTLHIDVSKSLIDHITDQKSKYTFYIAITFITFNQQPTTDSSLDLAHAAGIVAQVPPLYPGVVRTRTVDGHHVSHYL